MSPKLPRVTGKDTLDALLCAGFIGFEVLRKEFLSCIGVIFQDLALPSGIAFDRAGNLHSR